MRKRVGISHDAGCVLSRGLPGGETSVTSPRTPAQIRPRFIPCLATAIHDPLVIVSSGDNRAEDVRTVDTHSESGCTCSLHARCSWPHFHGWREVARLELLLRASPSLEGRPRIRDRCQPSPSGIVHCSATTRHPSVAAPGIGAAPISPLPMIRGE